MVPNASATYKSERALTASKGEKKEKESFEREGPREDLLQRKGKVLEINK